MSAVFADTFYWIALTNVQDLAHEKAKGLTRSTNPALICTTEEVLIEHLIISPDGVCGSGSKP